MADLSTKKWFVYVGDHHEGPVSLEDIQGMLAQGRVTTGHFAWCEGMGDWKAMVEIPDFSAILGAPSAPSAPAAPPMPANDGLTRVGGLETAAMVRAMPAASAAPVAGAQRIGGSSAVAVGGDEKTGDLDPKAAKKMQKEQAKAAKLAEKGAKLRAKLHAKESKAAAKGAKHLGLGGAPSVRGGERIAPKIIKFLFLILLLAGGAAAYMQGYLNPVIENPAVKNAFTMVKGQVRPLLRMAMQKVPALGQFLSPLPSLPDVDPTEYQAMKAAALSDPVAEGGKVAMALSTSDLLKPVIHVGTNLPDGISLDVIAVGKADTLLNSLSFLGLRQVHVSAGYAPTAPFALADGKPLPRGMYSVYVTESKAQTPEAQAFLAPLAASTAKMPDFLPKGHKIFGSAFYFLGGTKDASYAERLKLYHDKLREKSQSELAELRQFLASLVSQFNSTNRQYQTLHKGRLTPAQKASWTRFSQGWDKFTGQLVSVFQTWNPEMLMNNMFHSTLYVITKEAGTSILGLHQTQAQYFAGKPLPPEFDAMVAQRASVAQENLNILQAKIQETMQMQPSPNGMPGRLE